MQKFNNRRGATSIGIVIGLLVRLVMVPPIVLPVDPGMTAGSPNKRVGVPPPDVPAMEMGMPVFSISIVSLPSLVSRAMPMTALAGNVTVDVPAPVTLAEPAPATRMVTAGSLSV